MLFENQPVEPLIYILNSVEVLNRWKVFNGKTMDNMRLTYLLDFVAVQKYVDYKFLSNDEEKVFEMTLSYSELSKAFFDLGDTDLFLEIKSLPEEVLPVFKELILEASDVELKILQHISVLQKNELYNKFIYIVQNLGPEEIKLLRKYGRIHSYFYHTQEETPLKLKQIGEEDLVLLEQLKQRSKHPELYVDVWGQLLFSESGHFKNLTDRTVENLIEDLKTLTNFDESRKQLLQYEIEKGYTIKDIIAIQKAIDLEIFIPVMKLIMNKFNMIDLKIFIDSIPDGSEIFSDRSYEKDLYIILGKDAATLEAVIEMRNNEYQHQEALKRFNYFLNGESDNITDITFNSVFGIPHNYKATGLNDFFNSKFYKFYLKNNENKQKLATLLSLKSFNKLSVFLNRISEVNLTKDVTKRKGSISLYLTALPLKKHLGVEKLSIANFSEIVKMLASKITDEEFDKLALAQKKILFPITCGDAKLLFDIFKSMKISQIWSVLQLIVHGGVDSLIELEKILINKDGYSDYSIITDIYNMIQNELSIFFINGPFMIKP
jgi:hypothetical protein